MPTFQYGTTSIDYTIFRKSPTSKSDCIIAVDWYTGVTISVPEDFDQIRIESVLHRKAKWILRKLAEFNEIKSLTIHRDYTSGEKFPYLGRQYRLKVHPVEDISRVTLAFQNGRFVATIPSNSDATWRQDNLRALFHKWYLQRGKVKLRERVNLYGPRMDVKPTKIIVKDQQARWGSCTKNGTVNINWKILMAPMRIVDYVVVHELAHLHHPDHSPAFWATVQSILPDYVDRKEWLRVHGPTLEL